AKDDHVAEPWSTVGLDHELQEAAVPVVGDEWLARLGNIHRVLPVRKNRAAATVEPFAAVQLSPAADEELAADELSHDKPEPACGPALKQEACERRILKEQ